MLNIRTGFVFWLSTAHTDIMSRVLLTFRAITAPLYEFLKIDSSSTVHCLVSPALNRDSAQW